MRPLRLASLMFALGVAPLHVQAFDLWNNRFGNAAPLDTEGSVTVVHDGELLARNIYTHHLSDNYSRGGHVFLDGDGTDNGSSGPCALTNIHTYSSLIGVYGQRGGNVTITGYSSVRLGALDTRSGHPSATAGTVIITNIAGHIDISGTVDLRNLSDANRSGNLVLGAAGKINVVNLDLARVKTATVSSPAGVYVDSILSNFPTATPANGALDAPPNTTIHYKARLPGNAYLGGNSYILKSGGKLRAEARGTIVMFK